MSLDVSLVSTSMTACPSCKHAFSVGSCGESYAANITHNLSRMAEEAGIYQVLWRPDENGILTASQLVPFLRIGVELLKSDPGRFRKFDAPNGWGRYEHFVQFVEAYLTACENNPTAEVEVSR